MTTLYDLNYRPATYWPDALNQEQLLARIPGHVRRDIARQVLAEDENASLDVVHANEHISEAERRNWGALHPSCLGGEFLPELGEDVEIARISLESVTSDQISIRARQGSDRIQYSVCDEYETKYVLVFCESELPLTLGELIELIEGSQHPDEDRPGGLLTCHWEFILEHTWDLDEAVAFASIDSAWYPGLAGHYARVADEWQEAKRKERPDRYGADEEYEEEGYA